MTELDRTMFTGADLADFRTAKSKLEYPSLPARLKALDVAVRSLGGTDTGNSHDWLHKILVTGSDAAGGAMQPVLQAPVPGEAAGPFRRKAAREDVRRRGGQDRLRAAGSQRRRSVSGEVKVDSDPAT